MNKNGNGIYKATSSSSSSLPPPSFSSKDVNDIFLTEEKAEQMRGETVGPD